jgi:hypothetical protein
LVHAEIQIDGGMVRRYGSGCAGSAGTPLLLAGAARTLPGDTAWLSLYSLPLGGPPVVLAFGLSNATSFGMPTPVDLGFLGFPGCAGWLEIAAAIVIVSSNGGARFGYVFPGPAFLGQSAFVQAFVFDPNHVRGASVTNAIELRAGY